MRCHSLIRLHRHITLPAALILAIALRASGSPREWDKHGPGVNPPRDGEIVVDQTPNLYGGVATDTLFYDYYGYESWQLEADNFTLGSAAEIGQVVWWGFYGGEGQSHQPPSGDETMRVRFYAARASDGLPDGNNILYEESFLNPQRVDTGRIVYISVFAHEYRYQVDLNDPVSLAAGTVYWVEVAQMGDVGSTFRWETGSGSSLPGHAFVNDGVSDWQYTPSGSFGLQLIAIPEPCAAALLLCSPLWFIGRGRSVRSGRLVVLCAALLCIFGAPAAASPREWDKHGPGLDPPHDGQSVFEQLPDLYWGYASDTLYHDEYGYERWQREADNFLLDQAQLIGRVVWWGFYGIVGQSDDPPPGDEMMRVRFHGARTGDGLPDETNILGEQTFLNPQRTATGRHPYVDLLPMEYRYEVELAEPVLIPAGSVCWIEIAQVGDVESLFRWETGPSILLSHAYMNDIVPSWRSSAGSFAVQLWTTPEPHTAALLLGCAGWFLRGRGRLRHGLPILLCAILLCTFASSAAASPREWDKRGPSLDPPRDGELVLEQQPNLYWGLPSDTAYRYHDGSERWQRISDNIVFGQDQTIGRVVWWGFYGLGQQSNQPPSSDETMRVRFYAARPTDGLPDDSNVLFEQTFLDPQRVATGRHVYVDYLPAEYRYDVSLAEALTLTAGITYWLEVCQIGDIESTFRWENSDQGSPNLAYINDIVSDWRSFSGSLALQLWTTPEPGAGALVLAACLMLAPRGRKPLR